MNPIKQKMQKREYCDTCEKEVLTEIKEEIICYRCEDIGRCGSINCEAKKENLNFCENCNKIL